MNLQNCKIIVRRLFVVLVCLLVLSMNVVSASEMGYTDSVSPTGSQWTTEMSVPKFDAANGALNAVEIHFTALVSGEAEYESGEAKEAEVTVVVDADIELKRPDGTVLAVIAPRSELNATLPAFDGELDFDGPSGQSVGQIDGTTTKTIRLTDAADLALFSGDGEAILPTTGSVRARVKGPGNFTSIVNAFASANVTVEYIYGDANQQSIFTYLPFLNQ